MYRYIICVISILTCATLSLQASDPYVAYTNALAQLAVCETNVLQRDMLISRVEKEKMRVIGHAQQHSNYLAHLYGTFLKQKRCSSLTSRRERLFNGFLSCGLGEIIRECSPALAYRALLTISQQPDTHDLSIDTIIQMLAQMALAGRGAGDVSNKDIWNTILSYSNHAEASARMSCHDVLLTAQHVGRCPLSPEAVHDLVQAEVEREHKISTRIMLYETYITRGVTNLLSTYEAWLNSIYTNTALSPLQRHFINDSKTRITQFPARYK